ncbi:ABC transporter substrate-binding protein [Anaeromassilibacillus senegalensis]|uniref:ABC transporter substrate-binding protein n=1 Tax=Anaeromassilibacillus senegalensis TaxID=1673717 RepID=UPI0006825338|nr:ABC transporter substrate-binding protein [Anaeromassilibacillus senegalensis]
MKKRMLALLLTAALLFAAVGCTANPTEETPQSSPSSQEGAVDTGTGLLKNVIEETGDTITLNDVLAGEVTIQKRPQQVLVLLNSVLDLWYMAGGSAVARIEGEDNIPDAAKDLPTIGTMSTPSVEKIVGYQPDLVILVNTLTKHREIQPALQQAGVPNISVSYKDYDDFLYLFELFTHITDQSGRGGELGEIKSKVDAEIAKAQGKPKQKAMILYATASYVKAGVPKSVVGDMLERLGAENIIDAEAAHGESMVDFSMEKVLESNPDVLFIQMARDGKKAEENAMNEIQSNPAWQEVNAVKNNRIYVVPREFSTLKPNARYPEAFAFFNEKLYGDEA